MTAETHNPPTTDEALERVEAVFRNPSPFRRIWGHLDELILQHHIYNALLVYKPAENIDIVDLGCGKGELLYSLKKYYLKARFFGVDFNERSVQEAQRLAAEGIFLLQGSYTDIFKAIEKADLVICSEVFEHVEDYHDLLNNIASLVKPGGYLSISTPSGWMYRLPGPTNLYLLLKSPRRFYRMFLTPENHWQDALAVHPAIFPKKLIKLLKQYGFTTKLRRSSLWRMRETYGIIFKLFSYWAQKSPLRVSLIFESYFRVLDSLMNIIPIFRIFETRFILLAQKNNL